MNNHFRFHNSLLNLEKEALNIPASGEISSISLSRKEYISWTLEYEWPPLSLKIKTYLMILISTFILLLIYVVSGWMQDFSILQYKAGFELKILMLFLSLLK